MKNKIAFVLSFIGTMCLNIATAWAENPETPYIKKTISSQQRIEAGAQRHRLSSDDWGKDYVQFKNQLAQNYGLSYALDISVLGQRASPSGKKNSWQTIIYPSFVWTNFDNSYGKGQLNVAYNMVRYGGISGAHLGQNIGVVNGINDYTTSGNSFDEFFYSYHPKGKWDFLSLGIGQFPLYHFDGTNYDSNQQVNFINEALSQNLTSTYATSGLGLYAQMTHRNWSLASGVQDATNTAAESIRFNHLSEHHYTSFASLTYSPYFSNFGQGEYSLLLYNQPWVSEQQQTTNGWSLNFSQDIGKKLSLFARINGISGDIADFKNSYVLGGVYNNPLNRHPLDQIGLAIAYNRLNRQVIDEASHNYETILEAYWTWGISKYLAITPDIMIYHHPADKQKSRYAGIYTLRASLFF